MMAPAQQERLRGYLLGFVLALLLSLVPFACVHYQWLDRFPTMATIGICAVLQVLVHLRYFLHLRLSEAKERFWLLVFTLLLIGLMVGGSLWIMWDLTDRMMGH
ncbi:cytochrome o ubiquinol oxidase subunit IV [Bowmanella dokdonensis]|uniref:Cytochrome bo(3) ubiquinol oxidase subunit 4 n=1 Tax=Bowmanella dokdonensis TaxID=751969 RepID=A0A939DP60_9ALTE|nr:cytochrome o ubiquinol oxidase subunit IV [Bowmanella dokdonensis]MBN7826190.1 cytochrome o ubiquinol oxidase subunit IV [Bowmanella dokdonensis]